MATDTLRAESACNNPLTFTLSPGMAPAAPLLRLLSRFDRAKVEAFAEVSIAMLDLVDGDSDFEGSCDEDEISRAPDFGAQFMPKGPGCTIADPDEGVDDGREDQDEREADPGEYDAPIPISGGGSGDC